MVHDIYTGSGRILNGVIRQSLATNLPSQTTRPSKEALRRLIYWSRCVTLRSGCHDTSHPRVDRCPPWHGEVPADRERVCQRPGPVEGDPGTASSPRTGLPTTHATFGPVDPVRFRRVRDRPPVSAQPPHPRYGNETALPRRHQVFLVAARRRRVRTARETDGGRGQNDEGLGAAQGHARAAGAGTQDGGGAIAQAGKRTDGSHWRATMTRGAFASETCWGNRIYPCRVSCTAYHTNR